MESLAVGETGVNWDRERYSQAPSSQHFPNLFVKKNNNIPSHSLLFSPLHSAARVNFKYKIIPFFSAVHTQK